MRNNKGITLVALVITIIVLLILAGVSIAALGGQNGILTNATSAKQNDELAAGEDQMGLTGQEALSAYYNVTYAGATDTSTIGNAVKGKSNEQTAVYDAIKAVYPSTDGNGTMQNGVKIKYNDTSKKVRLTSTDGKKEIIGTVNNGGGITWGSVQNAGTDTDFTV